jgi:hypothetical protein
MVMDFLIKLAYARELLITYSGHKYLPAHGHIP